MNYSEFPIGDPQETRKPRRFEMPYPDVGSMYGASMGRSNWTEHRNKPVKFHLERVRGYDTGGDYDKGGAYWGNLWGSPLYQAFGYAQCEEEPAQRIFVRAKTREDAKQEILKTFPLARFYR